ncbi:unnamed protein product [Miscanthus lutarioriparius]|uniref:Uncharacterized protein n=1 Tax=Miscanthus lutarioriparius TaxID=422564 RepID=A0A811Q6B0_9POAL|nr:unnamed protein product [Miscanthus lutarioriparius]
MAVRGDGCCCFRRIWRRSIPPLSPKRWFRGASAAASGGGGGNCFKRRWPAAAAAVTASSGGFRRPRLPAEVATGGGGSFEWRWRQLQALLPVQQAATACSSPRS